LGLRLRERIQAGAETEDRVHLRIEISSMNKHAACDVLIVSWGGGGNLPPLLAAGRLLEACDHRVRVLASAATRQAALDAGFDVIGYRRAPDPKMDIAFEQQAAQLMATTAGPEIARDVRDVLTELRPALTVVDCMLPAGIAAGEAMATPTASLVHFPYGLARTQMLRGSGAWTTDRAQLNITRSYLGLTPSTNTALATSTPFVTGYPHPRTSPCATLPRPADPRNHMRRRTRRGRGSTS
jgi:hypothetical protein